MATATQLRMARAALGLFQDDVARLAGISGTAYRSIESDASDPRSSTMRNLVAVFEAQGVTFTSTGVELRPKANRIAWPSGRPSDPKIRAAVLAMVNAGQVRHGLPRFESDEE
jgi:DNA-binding XRE family transcriptional regulator